MTEQTENPTLETTTSSSVQAGDLTKLLEACREQAGMDIKTASENMRLSLNLLTTLEAEDFANLPEPPYVRGYLRSYAKLAETDAKPLIRTYELLRGADPDAITRDMPISLSAKSSKPPMSTETMRLALLAGVIVLLILISMIPAVRAWMTDLWASFSKPVNAPEFVQTENKTPFDPKVALNDKKPETDQTVDAEKAPEAKQKAIPQVSEHSETVKQDIIVAQAKAASAAAAEKAQAAQDAQAKQQAIADGVDPNAATEQDSEAKEGTEGDTANADETKVDGADAKDKKDATDKEKRQPLEGEVAIRLEFSKEVWMQIRQGERQNKGKRIFEALNSAGTVKELKAITPINFKIGNAPAAKLFLNGTPYDLKPHTRGSVARFVIK